MRKKKNNRFWTEIKSCGYKRKPIFMARFENSNTAILLYPNWVHTSQDSEWVPEPWILLDGIYTMCFPIHTYSQ
jgi:hypothetical protein